MKQRVLSACLMALMPVCAQAQIDLANLDKDMVGPRTDVLVLGSVHLSEHDTDPEVLQVLAESNVRPTLAAVSVQHYPQIWVQGWEIRNLRMVANILEVVRDHPGSRVLSIVGASHKPWFDGWLGLVSGVDIVDAQDVLKE